MEKQSIKVENECCRALLEKVGEIVDGMKKEQLDKNDPDNYGACYAIGGFNDALLKVKSLLHIGE